MFGTETSLSTLIILLLQFGQFDTVRALPSLVSKGAAPPPEEGPPQSASALRDRSKLKYEIIAIVLAYIVFTSGLVGLVLTVGRRLRRKAQSSNSSLDMEMVKPSANLDDTSVGTGASPVSPRKQWPSSAEPEIKPWASPTGKQYYHHSENSMGNLDEKVVEREKMRNQREMERLYAAVMAHEEQKESDQISAVQKPAELQHLSTTTDAHASRPVNPPPAETSPTSPRSPTLSWASSRLSKASPLSIFQSAHSRSSSAASQNQRSRRMSVRDLSISSPMGSSDVARSATYNDQQPLSPRVYTPGPPPATPGRKQNGKSAAATAREAEQRPPQAAPSSPAPGPSPTQPRILPFRQNYTTSSQQSAPATKTTFVERRQSLLYPGGSGPRTGLPVPYSPYMPNTPLTPITPGHLVTKEDRRRAKKQNGLKVLAEDELVKADDEIWGDGWRG